MSIDSNNLLERYESNPIARMIVSAIPYLGGPLDIALSSKWTTIRQNRIEEQLKMISDSFSDIETSIDSRVQTILESEGFYDLVYQIAENATKSRCKETRRGYARVLRDAVDKKESIPDLEEITYQLSELRERDFYYFRVCVNLFNDNQIVSGETLSAKGTLGHTPKDCERQLLRFEYMGLLDHARNVTTRVGGISFEKTEYFDIIASYLY